MLKNKNHYILLILLSSCITIVPFFVLCEDSHLQHWAGVQKIYSCSLFFFFFWGSCSPRPDNYTNDLFCHLVNFNSSQTCPCSLLHIIQVKKAESCSGILCPLVIGYIKSHSGMGKEEVRSKATAGELPDIVWEREPWTTDSCLFALLAFTRSIAKAHTAPWNDDIGPEPSCGSPGICWPPRSASFRNVA